MSKTIFEKIIDREIPSQIVYEDEEVIGIRDIDPQAPTHILIIPKRRIGNIAEVEEGDERLLGKMLLTAKAIAVREGISERGYRLVFNIGKEGGEAIHHLHLHLLGGRQMKWPPG